MCLHSTLRYSWSACLSAGAVAELETHLHISDKAVGEFIIDTARAQKDVDQFKAVRACARSVFEFQLGGVGR